jgi:hypothetical protein
MFAHVTVTEYLSYYSMYTAQNLVSLPWKLYNTVCEMHITHEMLRVSFSSTNLLQKNFCSNKYLLSSCNFVWDGHRNIFCLCNFSLSYFKQTEICWYISSIPNFLKIHLAVLNLLEADRRLDKHGERNAAILKNFPHKCAKKNKHCGAWTYFLCYGHIVKYI